MRKKRIIYYNDARHYYLFVFEPPMRLQDAWVPVDEVAGTAVNTFLYGVARGDGLFYPSKVGGRFGADREEFELSAYWRVWNNMQSLIDRDLDPLTVLVDRAHDKGMDFIASLRMAEYESMDAAHRRDNGGGVLAHEEVRDHHYRVLEELTADYEVDAVEMDLAMPGGSPVIPLDRAEATLPAMTEYVEKVAGMVHGHGKQVGARVLPTEQLNRAQGMDVAAWLEQGLVDFVVPMRYAYQVLDPDMPFDWLVEAAHRSDASVYPSLQAYSDHKQIQRGAERLWATPEQMRAAVANCYDRGADGVLSWFLQWPLGDAERRILSELGDADIIAEQDKCYVLARDAADSDPLHYKTNLPVVIATDDAETHHPILFYIADDTEERKERIRRILLRIRVYELVSADQLEFILNGRSLSDQSCTRDIYRGIDGTVINAYSGQWLEYHLHPDAWPRKGKNLLEAVLHGRADRLTGCLEIDQVHVVVEYGPYPSSQ